jgi:predicted O-linked N-acetylglucosamine transferase (SPINDLY family)
MTLQQQLQSGMSHHQAGRLAEAEKIYRQILSQQPDHAGALHLLGVLALQMGQFDAAADLIRRAIRLMPDSAEAHYNLGSALQNLGQLDAAIAAFRQAIHLKPDLTQAYINLANALRDTAQLDPAIVAYRQVIRLKPDYAEAYNNLGNALLDKGQPDEAIAAYQQTIRLKPDYAEAHNNLGNAFKRIGQHDHAVTSLRQAIYLNPNYPEAHYNLGNALKDNGQLGEAIASYRQAIRLRPDLVEAYCNLGGALQDTGEINECIRSFREVIRLKPDFAEVHSNLVLALNYQTGRDAGEILAEHQAWSDRHARPLLNEIPPHANERSPERRLRVGYVSADLWRHSVAHFFIPLLENHDRQPVEIFCYASVARPDEVTERIKRSCDVWRNILAVSDESAAKMVRSDAIDILVDLSGHTAGNRLRIFARKPAPIQVTYLGYANTTGMSAIDYRLTDALTDPFAMTDHLNAEKLWRLPTCAWCYHPPEDSPDIQPRGNGPITFGCFNAFAKINSMLVEIWAELLHRLPESHLLLKSAGAGEPAARQRIIAQFAKHGIASARIELLGRITTAGLPNLIAQTPQEYVSIASELAANPSALEAFRTNLRSQVMSSPLVDGRRFTTEVESAYRQMWRNWCKIGT